MPDPAALDEGVELAQLDTKHLLAKANARRETEKQNMME